MIYQPFCMSLCICVRTTNVKEHPSGRSTSQPVIFLMPSVNKELLFNDDNWSKACFMRASIHPFIFDEFIRSVLCYIAFRTPFPKLNNGLLYNIFDLMEKFLFHILCIDGDTRYTKKKQISPGIKSMFKQNNKCKNVKIKFALECVNCIKLSTTVTRRATVRILSAVRSPHSWIRQYGRWERGRGRVGWINFTLSWRLTLTH